MDIQAIPEALIDDYYNALKSILMKLGNGDQTFLINNAFSILIASTTIVGDMVSDEHKDLGYNEILEIVKRVLQDTIYDNRNS